MGADHPSRAFRRRFWWCLGLTVPLVAADPALPLMRMVGLTAAHSSWAQFALATAIFAYGGWPFLTGLVLEMRRRSPGMMTLVALAIIVAFAYSAATLFGVGSGPFFLELATLIDVMLLGHWIETASVEHASGAVEALAALLPAVAHRRVESGEEDVALASLVAGDVVTVRPGEKVPADGVVTEGASELDESLLTGESAPQSRGVGDKVVGGSLNGSGALTLLVEATGADAYVERVAGLVRVAQESHSFAQDVVDRAARWLALIAIAGAAVTFFVWWRVLAAGWVFALQRAVTVMVTACPHALGLAVPLVVAVSASLGARNGILVRDRLAFESLAKVDKVLFDKTGTLTNGRFSVLGVEGRGVMEPEEVLALAASLEALSEHPVARAIAAATDTRLPVGAFSELVGQGVTGQVNGHFVDLFGEDQARARKLPDLPETPADDVSTRVVVVVDGRTVGTIRVADTIRPDSEPAVRALKAMGVEPVMITGDRFEVARDVTVTLGIKRYYCAVDPPGKALVVRHEAENGEIVAMVGDGVNDALALVEAPVGIAVGGGTDVAIASAGIVLVRSDPLDVVAAIRLARAAYRTMNANLVWATAYNVIALPLAAGVLVGFGIVLSPAAGAALMTVSTVVVAVNALGVRRRFARG
jgi:Cu2+-exporting ATPase